MALPDGAKPLFFPVNLEIKQQLQSSNGSAPEDKPSVTLTLSEVFGRECLPDSNTIHQEEQ